ncbi:MAG: hypothetical protein ACYC64_14615 [Armatimonadota bacterium]
MMMNEFIASEKSRLQALFDGFNTTGSWMEMRDTDDFVLKFGLIDSFAVTRVAPHFDAAGNVTKTDFWVMFKSAGYNNGWQYTHTFKVVGWSQNDTYLIDLTDDLGRRYHVELLFPTLDVALVADWKDWRSYKAQNKAMFEQIDAQLLSEHVKIAETWQS